MLRFTIPRTRPCRVRVAIFAPLAALGALAITAQAGIPGAAMRVVPAPETPVPYAPIGPDTGLYGTETGFFHIEKIEGRDWFVDPLGRAVLLAGVDAVTPNGVFCESLGYSPYGRFVDTNYPSREAWAEETTARLADWGFTALGIGCDETLLGRRGFAHAGIVWIGDQFAYADDEYVIARNLRAPGTGFPNVFHPDFAALCDEIARKVCAPHKDDPWLYGWFLDNEMAWWGRGFDRAAGIFDLVATLPETHSAKRALRAFLAERGFAPAAGQGGEVAAVPRETKREFLRLAARKYFEAATEAVRNADPNHLVLGCRFAGFNGADEVVWEECGRYCDVVSFNCYPWADIDSGIVLDKRGGEPVALKMRRMHELCGKPLFVTEWSFPALDAGMPSTRGAGQRFPDQSGRVRAAALFARTMLALPFVAGYDWFMFLDDPPQGIRKGFPENSNYGLVNAQNEPYAELVSVFSRLQRDPAQARKAPIPGLGSAKLSHLSERDRFFAAAKASRVGNAGAAEGDAPSVSFRRSGARWALSNDAGVSISGVAGRGVWPVDEISFSPGGENVGSCGVCLHREAVPVGMAWTFVSEVVDVAFSRDPESGIGSVTMKAVGGGGESDDASGGDPKVAFTLRYSLAPGNDEILAEIVSLENAGTVAFDVLRPILMLVPKSSDAAATNGVPNLWNGSAEGWWQLPGGSRLGAGTRDGSLDLATFWRDPDGSAHGDLRFAPEPPFTLLPGTRWEPSLPMTAKIYLKSGRQ